MFEYCPAVLPDNARDLLIRHIHGLRDALIWRVVYETHFEDDPVFVVMDILVNHGAHAAVGIFDIIKFHTTSKENPGMCRGCFILIYV